MGATLPGPGYKDWHAFLIEIALTATLLSVILGTASAAQNVGAIGAFGVGGYIALAGLWAAPVSGTEMNPARSFGPSLVSGDWKSYWVHVAGPLIGAAIAVGCATILRGRGGDPISHRRAHPPGTWRSRRGLRRSSSRARSCRLVSARPQQAPTPNSTPARRPGVDRAGFRGVQLRLPLLRHAFAGAESPPLMFRDDGPCRSDLQAGPTPSPRSLGSP